MEIEKKGKEKGIITIDLNNFKSEEILSYMPIEELSIHNLESNYLPNRIAIHSIQVIKHEPEEGGAKLKFIIENESLSFALNSKLKENNLLELELAEIKLTESRAPFISSRIQLKKNINYNQFTIISNTSASIEQKGFNTLLKEYFPDALKEKIKLFKSDISFQSTTQAPEIIYIEYNDENGEYSLNEAIFSSFSFKQDSNITYDDHELNTTKLSSQFSGTLSFQDIESFHALINLPKQNFGTIELNSNKLPSENKSLEFLYNYPVLIGTNKPIQMEFKPTSFTLNSGLNVTWSFPGNNAYLSFTLQNLNSQYSLTNLYKKPITSNISYTLSGRWNRYFSFSHDTQAFIKSALKKRRT